MTTGENLATFERTVQVINVLIGEAVVAVTQFFIWAFQISTLTIRL